MPCAMGCMRSAIGFTPPAVASTKLEHDVDLVSLAYARGGGEIALDEQPELLGAASHEAVERDPVQHPADLFAAGIEWHFDGKAFVAADQRRFESPARALLDALQQLLRRGDAPCVLDQRGDDVPVEARVEAHADPSRAADVRRPVEVLRLRAHERLLYAVASLIKDA